jgi:hypothetical protein
VASKVRVRFIKDSDIPVSGFKRSMERLLFLGMENDCNGIDSSKKEKMINK